MTQPGTSISTAKDHASTRSTSSSHQTSQGMTASASTAGVCAVRSFLTSLAVPEPNKILALLVDDIGVTDGHALEALGRLDGRDTFLYSWVRSKKMTELQFAILTRAFAQAFDHPAASSSAA